MSFTKLSMAAAVGVLVLAPATLLRARDSNKENKQQERLQSSYAVLQESLNVPDGIPHDLLNKAHCVIVIPSVKSAAFIVGASYGRGAMVCRTGPDGTGPWGAPAMYALEGGSVGFQAGAEGTDYIFLVMNEHGVNSLLRSKVKLGADASVAAGPVGRDVSADTDVLLRTEILSYSRSHGVFAGVSVDGSTLRPDDSANRELYGRDLSAHDIVRGAGVTTPDSGRELVALLEQSSPTRS
jgi:SH3 domain-containing YSC84-like protein 1